jgi:hypothetical protein
MLTAFLLANAIALAFDTLIFQHYREMLRQEGIQNEFVPTLSGMIRGLFSRRFFWVQFVPMVSVCHGPRGTTESISRCGTGQSMALGSWLLGAHHALFLDQDEADLLPAILQGVLSLNRTKLRVPSQLVILLFACLNLLLLLIARAQVDPYTGIYFWSSLVCSYGIGMRGVSREERMERSRNHEELDIGRVFPAAAATVDPLA